MKNYNLLLTTIALCACFTFGCNRKQSVTPSTTVAFDTINIEKKFLSSKEGSPMTYLFEISFQYPSKLSDSEKLRKIQAAFIEKTFGEDFAAYQPREAVDSFIAMQVRYCEDLDTEKWQEETDVNNYNTESEFRFYNMIVFQGKGLISFISSSELLYAGNAHPIHSTNGWVYNTTTGSFITEDDFAGTDFERNMAKLITAKILAQNDAPVGSKLTDIGYDTDVVEPNGNFTVNNKGITYYYSKYEIAAGEMGETSVFIPFDELQVFISKNNPISALAE